MFGAPAVQPLSDLLQLRGQLLLSSRLALLPLAVLVPHRPPATAFRARRVHRNAVLQLDDLTTAPGRRAPGSVSENPTGCLAAGFRSPAVPDAPTTAQLWGFCGGLDDRGHALR